MGALFEDATIFKTPAKHRSANISTQQVVQTKLVFGKNHEILLCFFNPKPALVVELLVQNLQVVSNNCGKFDPNYEVGFSGNQKVKKSPFLVYFIPFLATF